jgi:hypothetical protein
MPGEYVISATLQNMRMMTFNGRPMPESDQGYAPTYYPGTPSQSEAQRITVGVGQEVSGVTFSLLPTRVSRISGRVVGIKGEGFRGFIMTMPEEGMMTGPMPGSMVQPDGTFEIAGVPPGRYVIRVQPQGRQDDEMIGMTTVTVAGADLQGITIALRPMARISGRIEFEGGVPPPSDVPASQVRVFLSPTDAANMRGMMIGGPPQVSSDFSFLARAGMGSALLRVNAPPGWYLKSVLNGGEDVSDTPIAFEPGADVQGFRVILTRTATTVSGAVRDDRGNLVVDATVVVFPADDAKWGMASRFIRSTRPDTQGRFEFRGLPPDAAYRIVALQGVEDGQPYDPEFLTGIRDRAERLALAEGEQKTLELRLRQ